MKRGSSKERSKSKHYQPQKKPSLANLMQQYNEDQYYNVKLNMNYHNPQIIQTKAYNLSSRSKDSQIKCRTKSPSQHPYFNRINPKKQFESISKYSSRNNSNKATPKKLKTNNLLNYESNYLISQPSSKEISKQGYGLFRQIIKKQSKENSINIGSQYYDLIQKKANEIKEEKKRILQRCHSNRTLSNMIQTMKANANNQIDQYAKSILSQNQTLGQTRSESRVYQKQKSRIDLNIQSRISETVGSTKNKQNKDNKQNNSIMFNNNQFSFQMDKLQQQLSFNHDDPKINGDMNKENTSFSNIFDDIKQQIKCQKQVEATNIRPFSKISHSNQNNILFKTQKIIQITTYPKLSIIPPNPSSRIQIPQQTFVTPRAATTYTQVQLKPQTMLFEINPTMPSLKQMKPIIRNTNIVIQNISSASNIFEKQLIPITLTQQDFLKTNDFNYPFQQHSPYA